MIHLPCHAKVNLFLHIGKKRPDGYHSLGTLFQSISCCDWLSAEPWTGFALEGAAGLTESVEDNLILKAARQLHAAAGLPTEKGIRFHLQKNLPAGGGLGGGSSDAAAALRLCEAIWECRLENKKRLQLAASLGADVPFFLMGGSCYAEGIGEMLSPAPPPPEGLVLVVATPKVHVDTKWAYGSLPGDRKSTWESFRAQWDTDHGSLAMSQKWDNHFEPAVRASFPEIEKIFQRVSAYAPLKTLLSGSGASVFAVFSDRSRAQNCLQALESHCRFSCLAHWVRELPPILPGAPTQRNS